MEILTSVRRLYIRFKSLVNDFVYSFGRAALLLLVEVKNHTVPVRERRRIRVKAINQAISDHLIISKETGYKMDGQGSISSKGITNVYLHTGGTFHLIH